MYTLLKNVFLLPMKELGVIKNKKIQENSCVRMAISATNNSKFNCCSVS